MAAGEDLSAADQDARIDAERVTDQAEHDERADAEPAAAHRKAKATAAAAQSAATVVATVLDVIAATEIIVTHGAFPSFQLAAPGCRHRSNLRKRKISIPLINNPPGKNCLARKNCRIKSIFTLARQCVASRLVSPASPAASPESEYLSHGCVASRGVCKGAPHSI